MKKYFLLILVISTLSIWPFLREGFIKSDDGEWMIIRFSAFHQSIIDGQVPVRFAKRLNNNYGYPVFNFLYPAPFYFSEIPKLLGFSYVNSIKITFIFSAIGSSLFMYWALSKKYNNLASLTGALVYLFAPYRFVDLYVRGSIGESVAFLAPPIIIGTIFGLEKKEEKFVSLLPFAAAFLILSHNVSAVLILPALMGYAFTTLEKPKFLVFLKYTILGIAISSFFLIPAFLDLHFVLLSQIKITEAASHLIPFFKLFAWPTSFAIEPTSRYISFVTLVCLLVEFFWLFKNKKDSRMKYVIFTVLLCVFLMTKQSNIFWRSIPGMDIIQFPWRLLSVIVLFTTILVADVQQKKNKIWIAIFFIAVSIATTIPYTINLPRTLNNDGYYSTNEDTTTVRDEYLPIWVKEKPAPRPTNPSVPNPHIRVISENNSNPLKYNASVSVAEDTTFVFNTIYFPGFKAKVDSKKSKINYENINGLISLELPKGEHEVIIYFGKSSVHLVSELVSIIALCIASVMLYKKWQKQNF